MNGPPSSARSSSPASDRGVAQKPPRIAAWANEPEESEREMSDEMPKVDPRLWALAEEASTARALASPDEDLAEVELGAEDLEEDDDATPCGVPLRAAMSKAPSARAPAVPRVPSVRASAVSLVPSVRASVMPLVPSARASALPRVPPPPRSRSLPPPVMNVTAFESTAPMVRTLSEPVIPVQPPEPGWNYRPWAAAAAAVFGLSLYGLSVLQLASTSSDGSSSRAAAQSVDASRAAGVTEAVKAPTAADQNLPAENMVAVSAPLTTAILPAASDATAASTSASAAERSSVTTPSRKGTKKASARASKKKKKVAKSKAESQSARLRRLSGLKLSGWN